MHLSDFGKAPNLVSLFLSRADELGEQPMLWSKRAGAWRPTSWAAAARIVCVVAENLRWLGLAEGDRVLLVSENRPEWCLADLAIMAAGCVTVPAYVTNTQRDHRHVLENSGARAAIVSTAKLAVPLLAAMGGAKGLEHVVGIDPPLPEPHPRIARHDWAELTRGDAARARAAVEARIAGIGRADLACIIYTSGTGGAPRGVRQHHGAILHNVAGAARILAEDFGWEKDEAFLSILPLSHAYEHTAGQFLPIGLGVQIYYAEGREKLASNIEEVRPTFMIVVPRLCEVLRTRILKQVRKQGRVAAWLLDRAVALAERRARRGARLRDRPADFALERLLRPKIRQRFGGRLKAMVSGGAPLNPQVGRFFEAIGLTVLQGYGQTEAAPVISCNRPRAGIAMQTVGPPLADTELRIAEDGEILVRGELVMQGYWRDDEESARALADGWLHTGDIGNLDAKGRVVITDRKKEMIVSDKGENVSPQKVEGLLTLQPEIAQAMVVGDRRPYLVALIVPDIEWAFEWARAKAEPLDLPALQELPAFRSAVRAAMDRANRELSVTEKPRRFAFADEPFTVETAELTPSLKLRRHVLRARYGERLAALYSEGSA
ncbi:MAG: AMP-dependent synthetase/ligase [Novosphingobium sp.]